MALERTRTSKKGEIAKILYTIDAFQFGVFKLSNGSASPYYVDLRVLPSFPDAFRKICDSYGSMILKKVGEKCFDRLVGMPVAGIPFAAQIAYSLKKPLLFVRKEPRLHGRKRRVEGVLVSGERVLLVDDLVTTGSTLTKTAKIIEAEGGVVKDAVVLLDREEGGKERLKEGGIQLHAFLKVTEVAKVLFDIGAIDSEKLKTISKQVKRD
ncbi:orotate phosphoribosyltransferase [Candidatus Bathyarchaeota archaeon]|nr:orotate phosphoribosyltransferase [Candidatus Bathyarchaeota archaeon]